MAVYNEKDKSKWTKEGRDDTGILEKVIKVLMAKLNIISLKCFLQNKRQNKKNCYLLQSEIIRLWLNLALLRTITLKI